MAASKLGRALVRGGRGIPNHNSFFEPLETRQHLSGSALPKPVGAVSEAPSALTATTVNIDRVSLSWKDNSTREIGFFVSESADGGKTWLSPFTVSGANVTTLTVKGLAEGSKYVFRVQAALPKKQLSDFSPLLSVFTLPKAPSGLVATGVSASRVDLTWNDNSVHETGERLERSTDGKTFATVGTLAKNVESFSDTTVVGGGHYWYRVIALGGGKESLPGNVATVNPLAAPKSLKLTGLFTTKVNVKWEVVAGASSYEVQRSSGKGFTTLTTLSSKFAAYDDTKIEGATQYTYRVRALSSNASSLFIQGNFTTVPSAPTNFAADNLVEGEVTLTWNAVKGATGGYAIEKRGVKESYKQIAIVDGLDGTQFVDDELGENVLYEYRVRALGAGGNSEYAKSVTTRTALIAPSDVNAEVIDGSNVALSWTDNSEVGPGFVIEASTDSGETWKGLDKSESTEKVVTTHGSTTYLFRVRAVSLEGGKSDYAESDEVTTPLASPKIKATADANGITITWEDCGDDAGYVIERSFMEGEFQPLATLDPDTTQYVDNGELMPGRQYRYRVAAIDQEQQQTEWSNEESVISYVQPPSDLTIESSDGTTLVLSWTINNQQVPNYRLFIDDGVHGVKAVSVSAWQEMPYTLKNLQLNSHYTIWLAATDYFGVPVSDPSNVVEYSTPAGPSDFRVIPISTSQIELDWQDNSGGTKAFFIERSSD